MKGTMAVLIGAAALALLPHPTAAGASPSDDDDLSVVRRAVADARIADAPPARAVAPPHKGSEPRWLKVRIQEKGEKRSRVSVNLPLALVRAVGSDWPIEGHRHRGSDGHCMTLGEVLRALDSGQDIVQIDDEDTTVRVWVE
jgi:hypothetical protein